MHIYFGESLRNLRRARGLTQEALAAHLNVSFQTISNWERDESWPDLSMLPVLAGFFGVTTDALLGVNEEENERHVQALLDAFDNEGSGGAQENLPKLKKALAENPQDYRLWLRYMLCLLYNAHGLEGIQTVAREVRDIYNRIDTGCRDDSIRMRARRVFVMHLHSLARPGGGPETQVEAEQLLRQMPGLRCTREHIATMVTLPGEAHVRACQQLIPDLVWMLLHAIYHNEEYGNAFPGEPESFRRAPQVIEAEELQIRLMELVCPDGDYGKNTFHMIYAHSTLAIYSAVAENHEKAFAALRRSVELATAADAQPPGPIHTSFLLRGLPYDKRSDPPNNIDFRARLRMLYTERYPWPEAFKADPRFGEILSALPELPPNPLRYPKKEEKWVYP